ncbi:MAG: DUF1080 domain-containing protein [Candidatus Omnitrophota bacterium]
MNSLRRRAAASLAGFALVFCVFAITANARLWRHEGLLIDSLDMTYIQEHLNREPWKSAWEDLQKRCQDETEIAPEREFPLLYDRIAALSVRCAIQKQSGDVKRLVQAMKALQSYSQERSGSALNDILLGAIAFENIRQNEATPPDFQKDIQQWLAQARLESSENDPWLAPVRMAVGVVNENEPLYQQGEQVFIDLLKNQYNDDGSPRESLPLEVQVNRISPLLIAAEIANHHSDLFYGNDLYHYSFGPKNLHRLCVYLFGEWKKNREVKLDRWGWLELAAKTYGEPEWLNAIGQLRPIFDNWFGGPVTLTHARQLETGLLDFGLAPDGFFWLYNKKDLTGWQYSARKPHNIDPNDFYVEDGVFYTKGASDHWLMTDRMYDYFILRLEYRIGVGSNSGILIWAPIPGRPSKAGFEVQLLDDAGQPPKINGSGSLYNVVAPTTNAQKPAGEWNEVEITCDNPHLKVKLNGQIVQDINLDQFPETQGHRRRGYIGLQDHSHKVAFRNVRIQCLLPAELRRQ